MRSRLRALIGIVGLWVVLWPAAGASAGASPAVSVFPMPGSQVVTPQTQITFRGIPVGQLGSIIVTGSRTGRHAGRFEGDSDGQGGSFLPFKPFKPDEVVTVRTQLNIIGGSLGSFHYRIAQPWHFRAPQHWRRAARVPHDVWHFHSRRDIQPARVRIDRRGGGVGGDIFVASQFGPVQDGPEILDPHGNVVWFKAMRGNDFTTDFRVQTYQGNPVLTWWQGPIVGGEGRGFDVILNSSYQEIARVHAGNGMLADLHEFQITPWNTALITTEHPVIWNTSSIHGPKQQIVLDAVVQEIDIPTGLVLFQWDSLDHVPVSYTQLPLPTSSRLLFDYFHVNSIDVDLDGNLVISSRNTWSSYKLDHRTGRIIWILGGRHSSFRMARGASFAFQHDVRVRAENDSVVTLFDDGGGPERVHPHSRGLRLLLDTKRRVAKVAGQDQHVPALAADYEGNDQQLDDGHSFIGWGSQPYFTEFDSRGREVFDGRFTGPTSSYRAYRFNWSGTPHTRPAVSASSSGHSTVVYVSWNGATDVASWRVQAGRTADALKNVKRATKDGFETAITIGRESYVGVQALDANGDALATSRVIPAG